MVTSDDLLSIGFYKFNQCEFRWESKDTDFRIDITMYDDDIFRVELALFYYDMQWYGSYLPIKTLKQLQNLIKALEGEE